MKNNKITHIRLLTIFGFFLFLTFGRHLVGTQSSIILPLVNCEYVGDGTTRAACLVIIKLAGYYTLTGLLILSVPIILALLFGRLWCGYTCPVGFIQDIVTIVRQKLKIPQVNFSPKIVPLITLAKWYLLFYLFFYDPCNLCPIPYFTTTPGGYVSYDNTTGIFWAVVFLTLVFINDKAFCRFCPIGTLIGLVNRKSGSRLKKCGAACTHCRACLEACPMDIQQVYEDRENEDITHPDCLFCLKCVEACPEKNALRYELFGQKIAESKRHIPIEPLKAPQTRDINEKWNKETT